MRLVVFKANIASTLIQLGQSTNTSPSRKGRPSKNNKPKKRKSQL